MEIREWLAKARLLQVGDALYISCISSSEAYTALGKFEAQIRQGGYGDYSLVCYVKPSNDGRKWWVCIAKVPRTDKGFIKKATGEIVTEGNDWITIEAQRIFKLAISDGKSLEEILSLAANDLEKRYIEELWKGTVGIINYDSIKGV